MRVARLSSALPLLVLVAFALFLLLLLSDDSAGGGGGFIPQRGTSSRDERRELERRVQLLERRVQDLKRHPKFHHNPPAMEDPRELLGQPPPPPPPFPGQPQGEDSNMEQSKASVGDSEGVIIPVLVLACDRPGVSRTLDSLIKHNPEPRRFPVIVSQDCGHEPTAQIIRNYPTVTHIKQPDLSNIPGVKKSMVGYYKISRHYKWALDQLFNVRNHEAVIIVEDDLEVSPDFFSYFSGTQRLLVQDKSLFCVSAWNDNGKDGLIEADRVDKLYRTDFFPGLGWMMTRDTAKQLLHKWPPAYWDDWVRQPAQMQDRACIRPEVSRTSTFGKVGVSHGQFFDQHLKFIHHAQSSVPFHTLDLAYLLKWNYDPMWHRLVAAAPVLTLDELKSNPQEHSQVRILYSTNKQFETLAKQMAIMNDFKDGVPRTAYKGVVTFMFHGVRVYLAPEQQPWTGYQRTAS